MDADISSVGLDRRLCGGCIVTWRLHQMASELTDRHIPTPQMAPERLRLIGGVGEGV
jgi:hypothetical protein